MQITLTTANTHWGRMITEKDGLAPVKGADILLLQEVTKPQKYDLEGTLHASGFELVMCVSKFGLAIAIRRKSGLQIVPGSLREHLLHRMRPIERGITEFIDKAPTFKERGLISVKFATRSGQEITVVNTHLTTPISVRPRARTIQIGRIGKILTDPYFDGTLLVAGDMNHYPSPRGVDRRMYAHTGLSSIQLGKEPTWYARDSKQEKWLNIPARILRKPIDDFNGQHDIVLYKGRGLRSIDVKVVDIYSDHRAIIAKFSLEDKV